MTLETVGWLQEHEKFMLPVLEPISSYFSIPRLDDKPQDPIVRIIKLPTQSTTPLHKSPASPSSPALSRAKVSSDVSTQASKPVLTPLWNEVSVTHPRDVDRSMSWGPNPPLNNRNSPFLTEQHSSFLGSLQNWAQPSMHAKSAKVVRITESDLFSSLHLVVLGTSSPLYVWDVHSQSFVQAASSDASELLVDAKHNGMSRSILQRFLDLGTLIRRLERLIQELRVRQGRTSTTVHAFAHGLSSVLMFIRNRLSCGPLSNATGYPGIHCLATVWLYYAELEQVVISLASMCSRSMGTIPDRFSDIPIAPVDLLSLVYENFEMHVERHSPRDITAVMAYILTVSSKPYIQALCRLLAYGEARQVYSITTERTQLMDLTSQFEGDEVESSWRGEGGSIDADGPFPKFIPENLASILPAAHKSLKLLEAARPEHPIFSTELPSKEISWMWTEESIEKQWNGVEIDDHSPIAPATNSLQSRLDYSQTEQLSGDHDLVAEFNVFSLEPGTFSSSERDCQVVLDELIDNFPNTLPSITPSLSLLCEVMFTPLQDHAASLSRALLAVFLDRSSFLCIDAHLELLRSHMLLTSHSFKSRLSAALFSDSEDRASHSVQLYNLLRYKSKGTTLPDQSHAGRWPVGLAPLLVTRDSWPPGGSELSFLLRTVIVDSQQNNPPTTENNISDLDGAHRVMGEAEFRLGFAIRELSGRGHERWLDPLCKALDFLYLDYKVPHPLQALIPTAVLSKYQRIFALLLRLTRVECAIRSIFRLTRTTALPLFPTLASSHRLLLRFRFAAHSFLITLSTYIYDTAIGGNFDAFLLRIRDSRETPDAPNGFRDVFALAECHSSVLDDILSACLLRSTQRATGDLLRGTLEVVLEFCVLVGDLKDGQMAEYQASPMLDALYASFRKKVSALMRALEVMLEKHGKGQGPEQLQVAYPEWGSRVPPGGVDSLRHLLTCLSQSEWWMSSTQTR
ncbi:Spc98 family-domain-containing protein [Lanmaoa asiatica]|nr:Spc98 family-domain-containing protein [Lanmaoa asiatica]